jgi:SAM-dependent methyltransferase
MTGREASASPKDLERVTREGQLRLYPKLSNPNWLVLRSRREIFTQWIDNFPPQGLRVLDVGGRIQPYRPLLKRRIKTYVAVDVAITQLVDVVARAESLPLPANQFDLAFCTQMLQYVPDPASVISEILRVLKPGGHLLLSVPSVYPIDSGEECWRFLPGALRHLLAAFSMVQIEAEGGSISGFFRTMNVCLDIFAKYNWLRSIYRHTACPAFNLAGALLQRASGSVNTQFAVNYSVLATK